jgi:Glycosyl hydrolases family 39
VLFHKFPEESIQAKIIAPVVPSLILPQGNISFLDQFCLSDGASGNYPLRAPKKRRSTPNCPEVLVRKENTATILLTNHAMPRHPIQTELLNLRIANAPEPRVVYIERIDEDHANPRRLWQAMGEPLYLNALQVEQLKAASCLVKQPQPWRCDRQNLDISISLPPHAVAAITIEFV